MDVLWAILDGVLRNAPGALARVVGCAFAGAVVGGLLVPAVYLPLSRRGWLSLDRDWDRWIRWGFLALWIVTIPLILAWSGLLVGTGMATVAAIENERLGERAGTLAFGAVAAGALATEAEDDDGRLAMTQVYMSGERTVAIDDLDEQVRALPDRVAEETVERTVDRATDEDEGTVRATARLIGVRVLGWLACSQAEDRLAALEPVVADLEALDAADDGDGRVTTRQIAASVSRIHLEPRLTGWIRNAFVGQAALFTLPVLLLVLVPVGILRLVARAMGPAAPTAPGEGSAAGEEPGSPGVNLTPAGD